MKKNKGYTLTEVLIALCIVGVISAITIPVLLTEYNKRINVATLSTAVTSFQTAVSEMMAKKHSNNVYETSAWRTIGDDAELNNATAPEKIASFFDSLGEFLKITDYDTGFVPNYPNSAIKGIDNAVLPISVLSDTNMNFANAVCFYTENGVNYYIYVPQKPDTIIDEQENIGNGVPFANVAAQVFIDANGYEKPNKVGRDIFAFILGSDGNLYPYGGVDVSYVLTGNTNNVWNGNANYACTDNRKTNNGFGCTARLVENGYNMDY